MSKPSIPKGTRDFGPDVMARRNWMFSVMRDAFERFGFQPIETPAMESLSTLTGKYGEEGDQLIFKILNNGDYLGKADERVLSAKDSSALVKTISKKALRYDLTVPFARFVVMSRNELTFPFRRYQMQNVWRGDRPGKGRYQEFTQCDADIIGTESFLCELELMLLFNEVLTNLNVPNFRIIINDRRLLNGLARAWNIEGQFQDFTVALDKWDKVGNEGVRLELESRGFQKRQIEQCMQLFLLLKDDQAADRMNAMKTLFDADDSDAHAAWKDVDRLIETAIHSGIPEERLVFDPTLARGLNYYTGAIFEVRVDESPVGSICGGGRYGDLTGVFGWEGMSGVGISFGADRIYDVLDHFEAFPNEAKTNVQVLVLQLEESEIQSYLNLINDLRAKGIRAMLYPELTKVKKQMKYASDIGAPIVLMAGNDERSKAAWTLKDMDTGNQQLIPTTDVVDAVLSQF